MKVAVVGSRGLSIWNLEEYLQENLTEQNLSSTTAKSGTSLLLSMK